MMARLDNHERVSMSFRFEPGSARLDAQFQSNVSLLARMFEAGVYDARTILFAGFSDGDGRAAANREIVLERAETVRAAVIPATETARPGRVDVIVAGFGEALPMACDDSSWGWRVSRRVGVWVK